MKRKIMAVALCSLFFSCKSTLKIIKGIKDPKIETYASTRKYLFKKSIDTTHIVYFKDINSFLLASKKKYVHIPNAFFLTKTEILSITEKQLRIAMSKSMVLFRI